MSYLLGLLASSASGSGYAASVLADSPIGYWKLAETSGNIAKNEIDSNDGDYLGEVALGVTGIRPGEKSVRFSANGRVNCHSPNSYQITVGTIECWFKTGDNRAGYFGIFGKQLAYSTYLIDDYVGYYDWVGQTPIRSNTVFNDSQWHHLVLTFQNGVAAGTKVYVDDVVVASGQFSFTSQANSLIIASGYGDGSDQNFAGNIAHCALYNYLLTDNQIRKHYLIGSGLSDDNGEVPEIPGPMTNSTQSQQTPDYFLVDSSTPGSTKKIKITYDDEGTPSTEVIDE